MGQREVPNIMVLGNPLHIGEMGCVSLIFHFRKTEASVPPPTGDCLCSHL